MLSTSRKRAHYCELPAVLGGRGELEGAVIYLALAGLKSYRAFLKIGHRSDLVLDLNSSCGKGNRLTGPIWRGRGPVDTEVDRIPFFSGYEATGLLSRFKHRRVGREGVSTATEGEAGKGRGFRAFAPDQNQCRQEQKKWEYSRIDFHAKVLFSPGGGSCALLKNRGSMGLTRENLVANYTREDKRSFLAVLLRMARADEVSTAERNILQPIAEWMSADKADLEDAARRAFDCTVSLADLTRQHRTAKKGMLLFREACAVVWVDSRKSETEQNSLEELGSLLGLATDVTEILDSPLACSPEGERRFLELLGGP